MLESVLGTMIQYTVVVVVALVASDKCRGFALGCIEQPRFIEGCMSALLMMCVMHVVGTLVLPYSSGWWLRYSEEGERFVIWPRFWGLTLAWFVAGWHGWFNGCQQWKART